MLKCFVVKKNERAILFRDGDFERILDAGRHYMLDPLGRFSVQTWKVDGVMGETALVDLPLRIYLLICFPISR